MLRLTASGSKTTPTNYVLASATCGRAVIISHHSIIMTSYPVQFSHLIMKFTTPQTLYGILALLSLGLHHDVKGIGAIITLFKLCFCAHVFVSD